mgnify:CR=1 FL=1
MPEKSLDERIKEQKERQLALEKKIEKYKQEKEDALYLKEIKEKAEVENADNIENIYLLSEAELNEQIKIKAKQLALVAYKTGEYDLYRNKDLIATIDENGMVELEEEYSKELEKYLPPESLEMEKVDPEEMIEKSKEEGKTDLKKEEEKEKEEEEKEETVDKLKEDTGLEIISLVRIEDERFSDDVVGYQTGYSEQYVALTKDGTFHLVGEKSDGSFEEHPDFLGATSAHTSEQPEYDENGNCCGNSSVDMVMRRSDGTRSSLGIDMSFGEITLTNRDTNEPIETSNYTPTQSEIDERKLADAKGREALLRKEKVNEDKKKEELKRAEMEAEEDDGHGWPGERKAPGEK